jgi:hypothetical protein
MEEMFDMLDKGMENTFKKRLPGTCLYRSNMKKYVHLVTHAIETGNYPCETDDDIFGSRCKKCPHYIKPAGP